MTIETKLRPPDPETRRALLPHARTGEIVWHHHVATVPAELPEYHYVEDGINKVLKGGPVWQYIFESEEREPGLRAQRIWGCDDSRRVGL